jgi:hypothetical protein
MAGHVYLISEASGEAYIGTVEEVRSGKVDGPGEGLGPGQSFASMLADIVANMEYDGACNEEMTIQIR